MAEHYRVDGMTCGGCARSVTNAIIRHAPDATVSVNLEAKTITITTTAAGPVPVEAVRKAVEGAGFTFGGAA